MLSRNMSSATRGDWRFKNVFEKCATPNVILGTLRLGAVTSRAAWKRFGYFARIETHGKPKRG